MFTPACLSSCLRTRAGSLERVIAQVNMEERQEHPRPAPVDPAGGGYPGGGNGGGGAGGGGGGGGGGAGGSGGADSGWTDMFQGMTVEVCSAPKGGCSRRASIIL